MGRRRRDSTVPPNPEVTAIQEVLEAQVGEFLRNVGQRVDEYEASLQRMLTVVATEEARKAATRASHETVVYTTVSATQSLVDAAAAVAGRELKSNVTILDEAVAPKTDADPLPPHYVVTLRWDENTALLKELQLLRRSALQMVQYLDSLTDWLALSMPDLNEENSAMAEVLGAVLEQITSFVESIRSIVGFPKKYLSERAEIEEELLKLPESKALQMKLELNDAETWDEMEKSWRVLVRVSLISRSVITKNLTMLQATSAKKDAASAAVYY